MIPATPALGPLSQKVLIREGRGDWGGRFWDQRQLSGPSLSRARHLPGQPGPF